MNPIEIKDFLDKYARGESTEAEHQQFVEWVKHAPFSEVENILQEYARVSQNHLEHSPQVDHLLVDQIEKALNQYELGNNDRRSPVRFLSRRIWYSSAAAFLLLIIAISWIYIIRLKKEKPDIAGITNKPAIKHEVVPGSNKATLMLGDSSLISLDDSKTGELAHQGGTVVSKLDDGQVVYKTNANSGEVLYNTLSTPKGGQFHLTLPDGSDVWLNSSSSIKYPTTFPGKERKVEITGEAYFEIAHNASKPFLVNIDNMEVRVLGTHFNINAYRDEPIKKTTLLHGSVSISNGGSSTQMKPGQQMQLLQTGNFKLIDEVDVEEVVAWKNGYFSFSEANLQTVMRQIARWYDVDVTYEGSIPEREFGGKISRYASISEVLKILQETKVHFRIEDKKIIVTP